LEKAENTSSANGLASSSKANAAAKAIWKELQQGQKKDDASEDFFGTSSQQ